MKQVPVKPEMQVAEKSLRTNHLDEKVARDQSSPNWQALGLDQTLGGGSPVEFQACQLFQLGIPTVQRQLLAEYINSRQGNRYFQHLVAVGSRVQREDGQEAGEAAPTPGGAPFTLQNERFARFSRLREIAGGEAEPLSARDNGRAVRSVQQSLVDIGYSLLRFHVDGKYGGETTDAVTQFRTDRQIPGTVLDTVALFVLDQVAPPPGQAQEHFVDYGRLFEDGNFDVTIALGFDEARGENYEQAQHMLSRRVQEWLAANGFSLEAGAEENSNLEHYSADKEITYPDSNGAQQTRTIHVNVTLLMPGEGAAADFGQALNESELTIYTGHARRGVGPDFDDKHSAAENFVMGVDSALHEAGRVNLPTDPQHTEVVRDGVNDLEQMAESGEWDPERYRIWFFNACTTLAYMDELRGGMLPDEMGRQNVDVFGSRHSVPIRTSPTAALSLLEGILAAQTMEQIVATMNRRTEEELLASGADRQSIRDARDLYFREGAGDNPVAPQPEMP